MMYLININKLMIPSLALATLKVLANKEIDEEINLIDVSPGNIQDTVNRLSVKSSNNWIGLTTTAYNLADVLLFVKQIKKKYPFVLIILGGPMVSSVKFSKELLENYKEIDIIVRGRADSTFPKLIKAIEKNGINDLLNEDFFNISFRNQKEIIIKDNKSENNKNFLELSPWLIEKNYLIENYKRQTNSSLPYGTGYGCPQKCTYCIESMQQFRTFSLDRVREELKLILNSDIKKIFFYDSIFGYSKKRGIEIFKIISEYNKNTEIHAYIDINHIDNEYLTLAKQANVKMEGIGLQTVNPYTSEIVKRKPPDKNKIKKIINSDFFQKNLNARIGMIYGLPSENYNMFKNTMNFALSLRANDKLGVHRYCSYPGTELYENNSGYITLSETDPEVVSGPGVTKTDIIKCNKIAASYWLLFKCFPFTLTCMTHFDDVDKAEILLQFANGIMDYIPKNLHAPILEMALANKFEESHKRLEPIIERIIHEPEKFSQLLSSAINTSDKNNELLLILFETDIYIREKWNRQLRIKLESKNRLKSFITAFYTYKIEENFNSFWFYYGRILENFPIILKKLIYFVLYKYKGINKSVIVPFSDSYNELIKNKPKNILIFRTMPIENFKKIIGFFKDNFKKATIDCVVQDSYVADIQSLSIRNSIIIKDGMFEINNIKKEDLNFLKKEYYDWVVIPSNNRYFHGYNKVIRLSLKIKHKTIILMTKDLHISKYKYSSIGNEISTKLIKKVISIIKSYYNGGIFLLSSLLIIPFIASKIVLCRIVKVLFKKQV